jgi:hypothetical protein
MFQLLVPLAILCFAAFAGFCVYVVAEAWYYQGQIAENLQRDLGFTHGTPYIASGRRTADVLIVGCLTPGGIFERAGFREGDILHRVSITGLYKMLHRGRGSEVRFMVIEGGHGPPLEQRPKRVITIRVPTARLA